MALPCSKKDLESQISWVEDCDGQPARRVRDAEAIKALQDLNPNGGSPKNQIIFNETIAVADTEQSLVLPTSVCGYFVKTRGKGSLKITHTSGDSGTNYLEIPPTSGFTNSNSFNNLTLYFQSPLAGETVEIVVWT